MSQRTCSVDGCDKASKARGWCGAHWLRWRKYGDPTELSIAKGPAGRRFWSRVSGDSHEECWEWRGTLRKDGYGQFSVDGRALMAHRFAYEFMVAPIPDGLQLDHLCRNRSCVNPWHLEPVTPQVNTLRNTGPSAINAVKAACPAGHPYDDANTRTKGNRRVCRECTRQAARDRRAKERVA